MFRSGRVSHPATGVKAGRPPEQRNGSSTHQALVPVIVLGQLFSLLPVCRYTAAQPGDVTFRWRSVRFLYSCLVLTVMGSIAVMFVAYVGRSGSFGLTEATTTVYYAVVLFCMVEFIGVARRWHRIMNRWHEDEQVFLRPPYRAAHGLPLDRKILLAIVTVLTFAFVEDALNFLSVYTLNQLHIANCPHRKGFWQNFYHREHPYVLKVLPYHFLLAWTLELMMRIAKYSWNYIDVFLICISIGLQHRLAQFNERLERLGGREQSPDLWRNIRLDFVRLTELIHFLDAHLSRLVLVSCATNMFFVAVQLFNSFDLKPTTATTVYFWYSLVFLLGRSFLMLYAASSINEASLRPLAALRKFPTTNWNLDLKRLIDDASSKENALSGKRFFYIRRPLILAMAGTIVTYELVLLDQVKKTPDTTKDCNF